MSLVTVEVEIRDGNIQVREANRLPRNGKALLTILEADKDENASDRPFGLAKGEFVVPDDFNAPLPNEVLDDFDGR